MNDDIAELLKPRDMSAWRAKMYPTTSPAFDVSVILARRNPISPKQIKEAAKEAERAVARSERYERSYRARLRKARIIRDANDQRGRYITGVIIDNVCIYYGVGHDKFMATGRLAIAVTARQVASLLARKMTALSYLNIARMMGRHDHSTSRDAERVIEARMKVEPTLARDIVNLRRIIMKSLADEAE